MSSDKAGSLPNELLFIIFDQLERPSLLTISLVSKRFNQLSHPYLWRRFTISDDPPNDDDVPRSRRAMFVARCRALIRDPRRASYVKSLDIRIEDKLTEWAWPSTRTHAVLAQLRSALLVLPSLKKLDILTSAERERKVLWQMLATNAGAFPFRLLDFRTSDPPTSALRTLLKPQDTVEFCQLRLSYSQVLQGVIDISDLLPRLRWHEVPSFFAHSSIRGRHLQSLSLTGMITYRDMHDVPLSLPQSLDLEIALPLATVHSLHLSWLSAHEAEDQQLLPFLTLRCGIHLAHINALHIASQCWPSGNFAPSVLPALPELEVLEWRCDYGEMWDEDYEADEAAAIQFLYDSIRFSPILKSLRIVSHWGSTWSFVRLSAKEGQDALRRLDALGLKPSQTLDKNHPFALVVGTDWLLDRSPSTKTREIYFYDRPNPQCSCVDLAP